MKKLKETLQNNNPIFTKFKVAVYIVTRFDYPYTVRSSDIYLISRTICVPTRLPCTTNFHFLYMFSHEV